MTLGLGATIVALHRKLDDAGLPHAFGGALALAYCTADPRATKDIDVNIFVGIADLDAVAAALRPEVEIDDAAHSLLERDAQARLWWAATPVDIFLSDHTFHDRVRDRLVRVPFADLGDLPVIACGDLAVFKAFFGRPKDVLDVATMALASTVDLDELRSTVASLMGSHTHCADFFARAADTLIELRSNT